MEQYDNIPPGAVPFSVIVDVDPIAFADGIEAWQKSLTDEMEEEGITITDIKGANTFNGYYFPDKAQPRFWLDTEDTQSPNS